MFMLVCFFQETHDYFIRIYAKNEVGFSEPLENEEPFKVIRPAGQLLQKSHSCQSIENNNCKSRRFYLAPTLSKVITNICNLHIFTCL
jgi:hypothetical protein